PGRVLRGGGGHEGEDEGGSKGQRLERHPRLLRTGTVEGAPARAGSRRLGHSTRGEQSPADIPRADIPVGGEGEAMVRAEAHETTSVPEGNDRGCDCRSRGPCAEGAGPISGSRASAGLCA